MRSSNTGNLTASSTTTSQLRSEKKTEVTDTDGLDVKHSQSEKKTSDNKPTSHPLLPVPKLKKTDVGLLMLPQWNNPLRNIAIRDEKLDPEKESQWHTNMLKAFLVELGIDGQEVQTQIEVIENAVVALRGKSNALIQEQKAEEKRVIDAIQKLATAEKKLEEFRTQTLSPEQLKDYQNLKFQISPLNKKIVDPASSPQEVVTSTQKKDTILQKMDDLVTQAAHEAKKDVDLVNIKKEIEAAKLAEKKANDDQTLINKNTDALIKQLNIHRIQLIKNLKLIPILEKALMDDFNASPSDHLPIVFTCPSALSTKNPILSANMGHGLGSNAYDGYHHEAVLASINEMKKDCGVEFVDNPSRLTDISIERLSRSIDNITDEPISIVGLQEAKFLSSDEEYKKLATKEELTAIRGNDIGLLILYNKKLVELDSTKTEELNKLLENKDGIRCENDARIQIAVMKHTSPDAKPFIFINAHLIFDMPDVTAAYLKQLFMKLQKKYLYPILISGDLNSALATKKKGPTSISLQLNAATNQFNAYYLQNDHAILYENQLNQHNQLLENNSRVTYLETNVINPVTCRIADKREAQFSLSTSVAQPTLTMDVRSARQIDYETLSDSSKYMLQSKVDILLEGSMWSVLDSQDANGTIHLTLVRKYNSSKKKPAIDQAFKNKLEQQLKIEQETRYPMVIGSSYCGYVLPQDYVPAYKNFLLNLDRLNALNLLYKHFKHHFARNKSSFLSFGIKPSEQTILDQIEAYLQQLDFDSAMQTIKTGKTTILGLNTLETEAQSLFFPGGNDVAATLKHIKRLEGLDKNGMNAFIETITSCFLQLKAPYFNMDSKYSQTGQYPLKAELTNEQLKELDNKLKELTELLQKVGAILTSDKTSASLSNETTEKYYRGNKRTVEQLLERIGDVRSEIAKHPAQIPTNKLR